MLLITALPILIIAAIEIKDSPGIPGPYDIPYDNLTPEESYYDMVSLAVPAADLDDHHYHCVSFGDAVPGAGVHSFKHRAYTVPVWPAKGLMTYSVKSLIIRPISCTVTGEPADPDTAVTVPCAPSTINGGSNGRVDLDYRDTQPEVIYEACAAGAMQGYTLIFAVYRKYARP